MWPRINAVATQRFHEFADPLIQQSKPSWVYQVEMQKWVSFHQTFPFMLHIPRYLLLHV